MNSPLWKHPQDELLLASCAMLAIIYCATIQTHDMQRQCRKPHCLYLLRQELLPNPRDGTVWQQLWKSQENRAFITTMGIDVATVGKSNVTLKLDVLLFMLDKNVSPLLSS